MKPRRVAAVAWAVLFHGGILLNSQAEPPSIGSIFPAGGRQGSEFEFVTTGKSNPLPVTVTSDREGITIRQDEKKKQTYHVKIASDAQLGPHLLWFQNADGVAAPRIIVVGQHNEQTENEPNDSTARAHTVETLPATINGKLEKSGDIDCFKIEVSKPGWLIASVTAYGIDSPIDPLLHLRDSSGQRIAFSHDGAHRLDPLLAWKIEHPGTYTIEIAGFAHPPKASIKFFGSVACVYRLTISTGPWIHSALPLAISKSGTELKLRGWNTKETTLSAAAGENADAAYVSDKPFENSFRLAVSDIPEQIEETPAQALTFPSAISGVLSKPGEIDRFQFKTLKNRKLRFQVYSAALEFPVDAVLRIESPDGKELARTDDTDNKKRSGQDPVLSWSAKEDGEYVVAVSDLLERGSARSIYRLLAREEVPDFSASTGTSSLVVEAGKTAELKVSASRLNGYKGKLKISFPALPDGITVEGGDVGEKGGEVTLKVSAETVSMPQQSRLALKISEIETTHPKEKAVDINIKGATTDTGDLLINRTEGIWLTVKPPAKK